MVITWKYRICYFGKSAATDEAGSACTAVPASWRCTTDLAKRQRNRCPVHAMWLCW